MLLRSESSYLLLFKPQVFLQPCLEWGIILTALGRREGTSLLQFCDVVAGQKLFAGVEYVQPAGSLGIGIQLVRLLISSRYHCVFPPQLQNGQGGGVSACASFSGPAAALLSVQQEMVHFMLSKQIT